MLAQSEIERLYNSEKVCPEEIVWKRKSIDHYNFKVPVYSKDGDRLDLRGYLQKKQGKTKFGFSLLYQSRIIIRSFDLARKHWNYSEGNIRGSHKHYYENSIIPRKAYKIQENEISRTDANQAVIDFCKECNIKTTAIQSRIF